MKMQADFWKKIKKCHWRHFLSYDETPCKRSAIKKLHHPYSRLVHRSLGEGGREKTSSVFICSADYAAARKRSDFIHLRTRLRWTSKQGFWNLVKMSRLHCITPWQGRKPSVLSEELLLAQKREDIMRDSRGLSRFCLKVKKRFASW